MPSLDVSCYACFDKGEALKPWTYTMREVTSTDVLIDIVYSGICGSDLHVIDNDWNSSIYPVVPGHEIIGYVSKESPSKKYSPGTVVGVGPQVYSCGACAKCEKNHDPICAKRVFTYSDRFIDGSITYGGYAKQILVNEEYVIKIPEGMDLAAIAPLLCAGATVYSPLHPIPKGSKVGIVGIGGLGHLAVQFSKALGHHVSAISHSKSKESEAKRLGADAFILTDELPNHALTFDFLLVTSSHGFASIDPLLQSLKMEGSLILVAIPQEAISFTPALLVSFNRTITSSLILGKTGMADMLEFAHAHSIYPIVEEFQLSEVNKAIERVRAGSIRYRAVLNVGKN